jgi:queuine tRNA-ribosyltransferase
MIELLQGSVCPFRFEVLHRSSRSKARVGRIYTSHGIIDTPGFVAVGTNGAIKGVDHHFTNEMGLQLMFCNTYHLLVQPGLDVIRKRGGLHHWTGRKGPLITDSGGFQIFSLAYGSVTSELKSRGHKKTGTGVLKITEEGVLFRSYRDGSPLLLTPESSVLAQKVLQSDIIIPLDELPPYHTDTQSLRESLERTHRWEKRSLDEHLKQINGQAMYAVVHGGVDHALREKSAKVLRELPFDGFAIGGSVGKTRQEMIEMLMHTLDFLPEFLPRHLLGVGDLPSLQACIPLGLDTFDSSYPTKAARHGYLFTQQGALKLKSTQVRLSEKPIEEGCNCFTCQRYTLSYLQHLWKAKELTSYTLLSLHNLHFMVTLMERYRKAIFDNQI